MSHQLHPLNFAETWQAYARQNMPDRYSDEDEIEFWRQNALGYDRSVADDPDSYRKTLNTIQSYVHKTDTLLDVGAGSGRFTLPLAQSVQAVTALDLSSDMLALLNQKAQVQNISNITSIEGNWENTTVEPHDVVLAAWSMYRQQDMLASLQKLVDATRRVLIIIDGDYAPRPDSDPPHERLKADIWGAGEPGLCNYLYFAGMLRQCRVRADIHVIHETMTRTATDPLALASQFAPSDADQLDLQQYTNDLLPYLQSDSNGYHYTCQFAVGIVIWQRI